MKLVPARSEKEFLLTIARTVAMELKRRNSGSAMRIRLPRIPSSENTDGWKAVLGFVGRSRLSIQIWYDRFTGFEGRKLWAGFTSQNLKAMKRLARGMPPKFTNDDLGEGKFSVLAKRLPQTEFGNLIFEQYSNSWNFYGFYDLSAGQTRKVGNLRFVSRAVKFFEDTSLTQSRSLQHDNEREIYLRIENRKLVRSHLHRERSGWLANERKNLDKHICQVCGMRFEDIYGRLGEDFAESHHVVPLSKLRGKVKSRIDDLRTVCANCHRMLHRMEGKRGDIEKLRALVRKLKR